MLRYKRNQVEEAIAAALDRDVPMAALPNLRIRIKRLLETDRALASRATHSRRAYAFYTGEAPGSGLGGLVLRL